MPRDFPPVGPDALDHHPDLAADIGGARKEAASSEPSAHAPLVYRVTLDRSVLEQAYTAIQVPYDAEPVPTRLCFHPHQLTLSTTWAGTQFTSAVGLRRTRNDLPTRGFTLTVSEVLRLVGRDDHLGGSLPAANARRLDFVLEPTAGRIAITAGGKTAVMQAAFETPPRADEPPRLDVRLRSAFFSLTPQHDPPGAATPAVGAHPGHVPTVLVSRGARWPASLMVPDLPLGALTRVLAHPGDLLARPRPPNPRLRLDTSELHVTFDPSVSLDEVRSDHDQTDDAYRVYVEIGCPALFACLRASGGIPDHGVTVALSWHSAASEMLAVDPAWGGEPRVAIGSPARPPARSARRLHSSSVHLSADTLRWVLTAAESGDRLLIGLRRGGSAGVLLARGHDTPVFLAAPSSSKAESRTLPPPTTRSPVCDQQ